MADRTIHLKKRHSPWRIDALDPHVAWSGQQGLGGIGVTATLGGYLVWQCRDSRDPWVREKTEVLLADPQYTQYKDLIVDANYQLFWNSEGTWWRTSVEAIDAETDVATYTFLAPGFLVSTPNGATVWIGGTEPVLERPWTEVTGLWREYLARIQGVTVQKEPIRETPDVMMVVAEAPTTPLDSPNNFTDDLTPIIRPI